VFDLNCKNPYVDATVSQQIGGGETIVSLKRPLTKKSSVESHYYVVDGIASLIGRADFSQVASATLTLSTFTQPIGASPRESLYLAGLNYVF
jgi:hypothetical protein